MCRAVCWQVTLLVAAVLIAHLMPKQSHWRLSGRAAPNSIVKWTPTVHKEGMIHFHFIGTGELQWGGNNMWIENHTFFHMFGKIPEMTFVSDTTLQANAHIFV